MISRSADGEILYANPSASSTFGIASWDLIGRKIETLYADSADTQNITNILEKDSYLRNYQLVCKPEGKNPFKAFLSLQPFIFDSKPALLSIFFNIGDR